MPSVSPQSVVDIVYLFSNDKDFTQTTIAELTHNVLAPLLSGNALIHYAKQEDGCEYPVGYTSWCWLTDEEATLFVSGKHSPEPDDYLRREGDQLWGIYFIALDGHFRKVWRGALNDWVSRFGKQQVHWIRSHESNTNERVHKGLIYHGQ